MSAVFRSVSLTALAVLIGVAAASEVKGPVHISANGVTDFGGDTARFQDAMNAGPRGATELAVETHIVVRRSADIARNAARRVADEARAHAREYAQAAREAAREAQAEARVHVAHAMAMADEAMRGARERLAEARRDIAERSQEMNERAGDLNNEDSRWDNAVEIRDGKVVRCSDPSKYPGTGCTPFTPEEKARITAETHAAAERARAALAQAEAEIRAAERALSEDTTP